MDYCTISFNLTHPCDCDMLDWFDTLTQIAGDCDRAKFLTLDNAKIGSFESFVAFSALQVMANGSDTNMGNNI